MKKYKLLEKTSFFDKGDIIKEDVSMKMYYDQDCEFGLDAHIVENCPTVFEEILELPYEIIKDEVEILAIIRKSDRQRFKLGDNIALKDIEGYYIIDKFTYDEDKLIIIEEGDEGITYIINVLKELEGMTLSIPKNPTNEEKMLEILEQMQNFYKESFTKITKLLNK